MQNIDTLLFETRLLNLPKQTLDPLQPFPMQDFLKKVEFLEVICYSKLSRNRQSELKTGHL